MRNVWWLAKIFFGKGATGAVKKYHVFCFITYNSYSWSFKRLARFALPRISLSMPFALKKRMKNALAMKFNLQSDDVFFNEIYPWNLRAQSCRQPFRRLGKGKGNLKGFVNARAMDMFNDLSIDCMYLLQILILHRMSLMSNSHCFALVCRYLDLYVIAYFNHRFPIEYL